MESITLQELVRQYIQLPSSMTGRGWYSIRCQVCDDHKHKKRGGWKFEDNLVTYNCFNCSAKAIYDEDQAILSADMRKILAAYHVPEEEISKLVIQGLKKNKGDRKEKKVKKFEVKPIILPSHFYELNQDIWSELAREYLSTRSIEPDQHRFYLSTDKDWKGRLIIPYYKDSQLIFYQGRDLLDREGRVKYLNPSDDRQGVFYGYDQINKNTELPLYVTEGFFDAFVIDGVATLSNVLSATQLDILKQCKRPKVIIPDRRGDGHIVAQQAIDRGWSVAFPDIASCKDVSEAVAKYGKIFVLKSIIENTYQGIAAKTRVNVLCEQSKKNKAKKKDER